MEAVCKGRGSGSLGRRRSSWMDHKLVTNLLQFSFEMAMSFATIGPRSGHDRCPGQSSIAVRSTREDFATPAPRLRLDRAAIVEFFHASSGPLMKIVT